MSAMLRLFVMMVVLGFAHFATAACLVIGPSRGEGGTLQTHTCAGFCFGASSATDDTVAYYGLLLGLAHASMQTNDVMRMFRDERCDINGCSVQLLSQLNGGALRGLSLTGLVAAHQEMSGWQLSGLANDAKTVRGAQTALGINVAQDVRGVQVGILNLADDLKGVQIGLINVNRAGWAFPLINISW
ncbi:MAG: hypothetical protein IJV69_03810 [Kiritimatiellae bacterium]|nr:hypothetical protein [Kiritimatiellia bacterium]